MPRASKKVISDKTIKDLSTTLTTLISSLKTSDYISQFFDTFLTKEEKLMVSKRLMLYILLEKGLSTTKITKILTISPQTVLTHRKNWDKSGELYKEIMRIMNGKKKEEDGGVWQKINDALYPLDLILDARSNMQARAKLYDVAFDTRRPRSTKNKDKQTGK